MKAWRGSSNPQVLPGLVPRYNPCFNGSGEDLARSGVCSLSDQRLSLGGTILIRGEQHRAFVAQARPTNMTQDRWGRWLLLPVCTCGGLLFYLEETNEVVCKAVIRERSQQIRHREHSSADKTIDS